MTRKNKLKEAARLIGEVLQTLERGLLPQCASCNCTPRKNHSEYQRGVEMEAMLVKLNRWSSPASSDFQDHDS